MNSTQQGCTTGSDESRVGGERRQTLRVSGEHPVAVKCTKEGTLEFSGMTRDIGAGGVFLYAEAEVAEGSLVELVVTLPAATGSMPMTFAGKVVRLEPAASVEQRSGFAVAFEKLEMIPVPD